MLAEERFSRILSIIEAEGSATIQELMTALDASESTVRRDLITMDENGLLTKVHGGAIARRPSVSTHDEDVRNRKTMNAEQKNAIAKYAASLIRPDDFVYLDAGTSTEAMIPFIKETQAVFVSKCHKAIAKLSAEKKSIFSDICLGGPKFSISTNNFQAIFIIKVCSSEQDHTQWQFIIIGNKIMIRFFATFKLVALVYYKNDFQNHK